MRNYLVWVIIVVLVALGAWYFSMRQDQSELEQVQSIPAPGETEVVPAEPRYPVESLVTPGPAPETGPEMQQAEEEPVDPLPALEESDGEIITQAQELFPATDLTDILVPEFLLSRLVATIDGLDAGRLAQPMRPVQPVEGRFQVLEANGQAVISPANSERYRPYLDLLQGVEVDTVVPQYVRYYPLLQEAYLGLGNEDVYFNDRVIEILDLLLATPEPTGLIEVQQNEAVYEFVDPQLESLAVGQKALLRLEPGDRQAVRDKLAQIRSALAGAAPDTQGENN